MGFEIRTMSRAELETALGWAGGEGWNPGARDAAAFLAADPVGYLAGVLDGRMVASVSAVSYGPEFGFIGLYIVAPGFRGRGHGIRLWRAAMARLAAAEAVGLDGVPDQVANYRRSGFAAAHGNRRYGGQAPPPGDAAGLVDIRAVPIGPLLAYDRRMFPAPRGAFLAQWIGLDGHRGLVAFRDGRIAGLGVARPCGAGAKVGPL